jgi:hypothetical protein
MDYRKILLAYLQTVLICKGFTYAKACDRMMIGTPCDELTPDEQAELDRLDNEACALRGSGRVLTLR